MRTRLLAMTAAALLAAAAMPAGARTVGECLELVPQAVGVGTDEIVIDVAVFAAGGVTEERARAVVDQAAAAYAPLHVDLRAASVEVVDWDSTDAETLMALAAERTGGVRPPGTDAVGVITGADLVSVQFRDPGLAGQAKCVGGIRSAHQAFFVAEDYEAVRGLGPEGQEFAPGIRWLVDTSAKVFAHELAHLLGAHHHYATCGPALATNPGTLSPCSLMDPDFHLTALEFNPIEGAVIRGYAEAFTTTQ